MRRALFLICLSFIPCFSLFGLNGLYRIGYGTPAKGIGGVAAGFPQDTLSAMTNPANLVSVGKRMDMNLEYLRGTRIGKIRGSLFIPHEDIEISRNKNMMSAEGGLSWTFFDNRFAMGLLIAPQAGGVTTWNKNDPFYPPSDQPFHIDVMYLAITPTFALEFFKHDFLGKHFIGVGVDLTPARLKVSGMQGLQNQGGLLGGTAYPNNVTNKGWDYTFGWAVRVGYLWEFRPWLTGGVAYKSKTWMSSFDSYKGLISPHGRADLPAYLIGGISVKPFRQTTIAFDIGRIYNRSAEAFGNPVFKFSDPKPHGASDGASFEWHSTTVYKVGITQQLADVITLRAGYNYGQLPWDEEVNDAAAGALYLPSTIRHHLTFGATLDFGGQMINAALIYGFKHSIHGPLAPDLGGGKTEVSSDKITLQVGISKVW
ncbi:OmpP1/FadL family transporter [Simkania sp.]|uniref:OmpP1/FadL family transporter n=1 Tax=Simkania sp. TaxID=34094 RepID=UPI003B526252